MIEFFPSEIDIYVFISTACMAEKKTTTKTTTRKAKAKPAKPEYKVVMSVKSPSLNYTAKRLGDLVSEEMEGGWVPHGTAIIAIDEDKYVMCQAMIKDA
jgi:hypothetical protein